MRALAQQDGRVRAAAGRERVRRLRQAVEPGAVPTTPLPGARRRAGRHVGRAR